VAAGVEGLHAELSGVASLVHSILLRWLRYFDPDRLVMA
jgi:hypothetical protein